PACTHMQRLKKKHKNTCESMTSEKPTLETILSIFNVSSISTFSTSNSSNVSETTVGVRHAQSDTSAKVDITTPQSVTWLKTSAGSSKLREAIISLLKVDHLELSSHKRNLISAPDSRTSAQICGFSGILLVLSVVLLIIFSDLVSIVRLVTIFIKSKICFKN
ncbi:hypothetical protein BgiMline_030919, partial [Biomphalaria glabrata]